MVNMIKEIYNEIIRLSCQYKKCASLAISTCILGLIISISIIFWFLISFYIICDNNNCVAFYVLALGFMLPSIFVLIICIIFIVIMIKKTYNHNKLYILNETNGESALLAEL